MNFTIEENPILLSRSKSCHDILTIAGEHAERFSSIPEGLLCLMLATVYVAQQNGITPGQLQTSIRATRKLIEKASLYTGKDALLSEMVTEMGLA